MFDDVVQGDSRPLPSVAHDRLLSLLAERETRPVITTIAPPCVVIVDLDTRRSVRARSDDTRAGSTPAESSPAPTDAPRDPEVELLEAGAGHLDAVTDLERVMARAAAAQARELASFARCRPASWDRQPGEKGAASAATRAARPAVLEPVSEWAVAEVAARLRLPQRTAQARLEEAVVLVEQLPATLDALETGRISPAHAHALVDLLRPVSDDTRAEVEAAALDRAGSQTVANLRARVRRLIARLDAAAALRRLVAAAKGRKVALYGDDDGMATLAASLPGPLARACYEALQAYARACEVDAAGNRDPRSLDERMADCLADLILRPHGDRPPVQVALTVVAGVDTLTGFGPDADEPGEVDGDLVPAALVRELAATFGLLPRPTVTPQPPAVADEPSVDRDADEPSADGETEDGASVDWTATEPAPGDAALEARIAALQADENAAAADLAAAIGAENRLAGGDGQAV